MEETPISGRRRSRGAEAAARAGAIERLKALRHSCGRCSEPSFQIKMEAPIYDTVAEEDYAALVAKHREAARNFIMNDDGLGYDDEGEEEDWEQNELPPSSDESEDSEKPKKKKQKKKVPDPKKSSSSLPASSKLMGKQRLSSMFASSSLLIKTSRNDSKVKGLSTASESIVDDIIAEFAPDETDRGRQRRARSNSLLHTGTSAAPPSVHIKDGQQQPLFVDPGGNPQPTSVLGSHSSENCKENSNDAPTDSKDENVLNSEMGVDGNPPQQKILWANGSVETDALRDGSVKLEAIKCEGIFCPDTTKAKVDMDPALSASAGVRGGENGHGGFNGGAVASATDSNSEEKSDFQQDSDGSLPFYMIDGYEEIHGLKL